MNRDACMPVRRACMNYLLNKRRVKIITISSFVSPIPDAVVVAWGLRGNSSWGGVIKGTVVVLRISSELLSHVTLSKCSKQQTTNAGTIIG